MDPLSDRARRLLAGGLSQYLGEHLARSSAPYDPVSNPRGYIGLSVAENSRMWDVLGPRLTAAHDLAEQVVGYDDMSGSPTFRGRVADLLGRTVFRRKVEPEALVAMAGAGAVLEALFYAVAGPGEVVLIPTPSYAGFWPDLQQRAGLSVIPVHTSPGDDFRLSRELLDDAFDASTVPVRALLYTNPDNPLGRVATRSDLELVTGWCRDRGIHLVVDEIYALSVFGNVEFSSVGHRPLGDSVHVVWAFSKDFAMSGLRAGVLVSENPEVRAAVAAQAVWGSVSNLSQAVLSEMIADEAWTDLYLREMRSRLASMHEQVSENLRLAGIPHRRSDAGFFVLLDLRSYLVEPSWEAEDRLWRRMLGEANVNLTPGSASRISEPGFFRLCFASAPSETVIEGVRRLGQVIC